MSAVILIGMPASGKSTIGVLLAKSMGKGFIDTDLLIQQQQGMLLQDIIDTKGLEQFLKYEEQAALTVKPGENVVATGGSMVLSNHAMEHLKSMGTVVYIKVSLDEIKRRLLDIKTRGIVMEARQSIEDIYNLRCPIYEQYADLIASTEAQSIEQTVQTVMQAVQAIM